MLGIGPDDIRLKELMARLQGDVKRIDHSNKTPVWKVRQQRCISANLSNQTGIKSQ
mgnify:CR=1 FL=1